MPFARRFMALVCTSLVAAGAAAANEPSGGNPHPTSYQGQPVVVEASAVAASGPEAVDQSAAVTVGPAGEAAPRADAARDARRAAFDTVVNVQGAKIRELTDRLASAVGDDAILELQQEITREKRAMQRRLLELQLEIAVREGAPEGDRTRVEQLEAALMAWDAPRPAPQPVDRPAPVNPAR